MSSICGVGHGTHWQIPKSSQRPAMTVSIECKDGTLAAAIVEVGSNPLDSDVVKETLVVTRGGDTRRIERADGRIEGRVISDPLVYYGWPIANKKSYAGNNSIERRAIELLNSGLCNPQKTELVYAIAVIAKDW